jgi:hypothetical protein
VSRSESEIEILGHLAVLELKPDDLVVVRLSRPVNQQHYELIHETWKRLGVQNKLLVLPEGYDMGVLRAPQPTPQG